MNSFGGGKGGRVVLERRGMIAWGRKIFTSAWNLVFSKGSPMICYAVLGISQMIVSPSAVSTVLVPLVGQ